jgi:hypothetical protein
MLEVVCCAMLAGEQHLRATGGLTVLLHQLCHLTNEVDARRISKPDLFFPILIRVKKRIVLSVVLPPENLLNKVHLGVNFPVGVIRVILRITRIEAFSSRLCRLDQVNGLLRFESSVVLAKRST